MMYKQNRPITLASGSPRRKSYLERYQLSFQVKTADVDETVRNGESPIGFAKRLAKEKGAKVSEGLTGDEIIISADTIVVLDNEILGKPETKMGVLPMLQRLNGKEHQVITSFFVYDRQTGYEVQREVITRVIFNQIPEKQLAAYAALEEPLDKAGAYSIQGIGTFLVKAIEGSYNNVVGLPIEELLQIMLDNNWLSI